MRHMLGFKDLIWTFDELERLKEHFLSPGKSILLECKYCEKGFCVSCIDIVKHECQKSDDCRKRKRDELEESMKYLSKANEYTPDYNVANFYMGNLYMKIQDYELAVKSYEKGLGSSFKNGNYKILYLLGSSYQRLGNLDMARQLFEYSLENKGSYTKAHFALANVLYAQHNHDEAEKNLLEIIDSNPSYIKAYELLVNLFLDTKDYNKAREYSLMGIEVNSNSYLLHSQLAFLDNEIKDYSKAIENANNALSLKRNYGPALIALATANVYLCNLVAAEDAFKRAKKYDRRQVSQLEEWAREHNKTVCK